MSKPTQKEAALFDAVLQLPLEKRAAYLDKAYAGDAALRQSIEALLQAHEQKGGADEPATQPQDPKRTIYFTLPSLTEKPGDRIGRYKILQEIGEGGCGVVYMAEQEEPVRRRVALKVIKLGMDTKQVIGRFEAERQALALMDHPHIAKVLDAGATDAGRPYFVMELVKGIRITDYCDQHQLATRERLALFTQVCHAIQHAHQKGIIHRDIKPSNVLVALQDGVPVPKVIDFGIAKATDQCLTDKTVFTAFEQFIGTPAYMSPEQAEMSALDIDTRSDIYALGVLLYELLTGKTPFDPKELLAEGLDAMRRTLREKEPARPSTRLSTMLEGELTALARRRQSDPPKLLHLIRGDLDWIVMKTLEKDRTRRYETANGLAADIQRHLNNEPVAARPPSSSYRFQKMVGRNKLAFTASGAVATAVLMGLGASTWMFFKERQAHQRAVNAEKNQSQLRQKAESEAGKARQVSQFLTDMLQSVGPSVAMGRDTVMLREILDKTAERLATDLKGQPEVEAELENTIGEVYRNLGLAEKAEVMFRKALLLRKQYFGGEHPDVATSMDNLAGALLDLNKLAEAENLHRQALTMRRKLLGNDVQDVATSLNNLALALWSQGKLTEAEAMHRESLALRQKLFPREHSEVATSLNNLAIVLRDEGRLAEAEDLHRQALAMRRKVLGSDHPDVIVSFNNLASVLWSEGKLAEAESLQRDAILLQRKLVGNSNPILASSLNNLATILWQAGRQSEAETLTREALDMQKRLLGAEHSTIALSLNNLAYMLCCQGKLEEAETMHREALAMRRKLLGNEHLEVAQSLNNLAQVLVERGKLPEAETLYLEALKIRHKQLGNNDPDRAGLLDGLAASLRGQNKLLEAQASSRDCLAILEKQNPDNWVNFNIRSRIGGDLVGLKKYADAEPLLLSGYAGMKEREAKIPANCRPRLKEAMERLVRLYEATERPDEATRWKARLAQFD